jgi:peptidoglycan/xylan/chitin deacetylase (PgdA/CDA1 family)
VTLFERQMRYLHSRYACISLDDAIERLRNRTRLPQRAVIVTFDDGYADNYRLALPILVRYRIPASIYLVSSTLTERTVLWTSRLRYVLGACRRNALETTDAAGRPMRLLLETRAQRLTTARTLTNMLNRMTRGNRDRHLDMLAAQLGVQDLPPAPEWFLSPSQIIEMSACGVTFGAHTVSHPSLPMIDPSEAESEVLQSKLDLELVLGAPVQHFSYPNSGSLHDHYDAHAVDTVARVGFKSGVTSTRGWLDESSDVFVVPRVGINRSRAPLERFACWLERNRLMSAAASGGSRPTSMVASSQ